MEDRFLCFSLMIEVSQELEKAGFEHVVSSHHIDPEWRASYRPHRPELEPIAWTIRISSYLLPMDKMKELIALCERHSLVVWWMNSPSNAENETSEIYLKLGTNERVDSYASP